MIVFDLECAPIRDEELTEIQKKYIQKKVLTAVKRDPDVDQLAKERELRGTDPFLSRIVCIGLFYPKTGQTLALTNDDEKLILESFWQNISSFRGTFISYNGIKFDVPYIIRRSIHHGIKPTNHIFLQHTKFNPMPAHFDVMIQISAGKEQFYSLHEACEFFGVDSSKLGGIVAAEVGDAYYAGRIQEIADYCLRDLQATYQLYEKVKVFIQN
jgi:hypothetical protein